MFIKMHKEYGKYMEHYRDIRGAWNKIDTFLQNHCPALFETLQGLCIHVFYISYTNMVNALSNFTFFLF